MYMYVCVCVCVVLVPGRKGIFPTGAGETQDVPRRNESYTKIQKYSKNDEHMSNGHQSQLGGPLIKLRVLKTKAFKETMIAMPLSKEDRKDESTQM